jgi:Sigma-70, region 4
LLPDSVGLALLVVLETLTPAERLAFVLHDMFAVPCEEIASIVDRSPEATRQLASRGRRRVRGADRVPGADVSASSRPRSPRTPTSSRRPGTPGRYNDSEADLQPFIDEMRKGDF